MAILYVTEFAGLGDVLEGGNNKGDSSKIVAQAPAEPPLAEQTVAIGAGSTASSPFNKRTFLIRVHTDSICSVAISQSSPTATTTSRRMAANQTEYFGVQPGWQIAVISNT